jgi:hypothetical protein
MLDRPTEHHMSHLTSAASLLARQGSELKTSSNLGNTTASDATHVKASFDDILAQVKSAVTGKPRTGFSGGATAEANSMTGQAKAALKNTFNSTVSAAKSLIPTTAKSGFK